MEPSVILNWIQKEGMPQLVWRVCSKSINNKINSTNQISLIKVSWLRKCQIFNSCITYLGGVCLCYVWKVILQVLFLVEIFKSITVRTTLKGEWRKLVNCEVAVVWFEILLRSFLQPPRIAAVITAGLWTENRTWGAFCIGQRRNVGN